MLNRFGFVTVTIDGILISRMVEKWFREADQHIDMRSILSYCFCSLLLLQAAYGVHHTYSHALTIAVYVGSFVGAFFEA